MMRKVIVFFIGLIFMFASVVEMHAEEKSGILGRWFKKGKTETKKVEIKKVETKKKMPEKISIKKIRKEEEADEGIEEGGEIVRPPELPARPPQVPGQVGGGGVVSIPRPPEIPRVPQIPTRPPEVPVRPTLQVIPRPPTVSTSPHVGGPVIEAEQARIRMQKEKKEVEKKKKERRGKVQPAQETQETQ